MNWKDQFYTPDISYWPEVRWWLAEGLHTDQTLIHEIDSLYQSGFGAVEFLAMDEPGADSSKYGWGSEEWVHDSHIILREATKKQMGVSMTSGTNWSNANLLNITPDDKAAAKELDYTSEVLSPGALRQGPLKLCEITQPHVNNQELLAVVAMKRLSVKDNVIYLDKDSAIILTSQVKGNQLTFQAPEDGEYELFAFYLHGTGQTASPSAGVSYTINYIDPYGVEAFVDYWNREVITDEIREYLSQNHRVQMYMDSLELSTYGKGGQFWGYHLLEEFQRRRGYDLTPFLPFVLKESGGFMITYVYHYSLGDPVFLEKLRNDLYQTMTDLYMENMLKPMQEWLHSLGMTLRSEISYGLPFEISLPGKYVDGIETESLEFCSQIDSFRSLAGPAHLYRRLYSSETGATLSNYQLGLHFYTQIIYTQFAAGVARTVLHGYSSIAGSEDSTYWPGHEGMWPVFSERFGSRQPSFRHYNDWTKMLSRCQLILRQGKPRVDLGIIRLDYNFNNLISWGLDNIAEVSYYEEKGFRAGEGIYWKNLSLQNLGYTYDYFAPQILMEDHIHYKNGSLDPDGAGYQALIIYQESLPLKAAEKILELAEEGLPILFVNNVTETIRPGITKTHTKAASHTTFLQEKEELLLSVIAKIKALPNVKEVPEESMTLSYLKELGISPRAAFLEENTDILTNLRKDERCDYLFVYNFMYTKKEPSDVTICINDIGKPWRLNCYSGKMEEILCYQHLEGTTQIRLTLNPGEACLIALDTMAPEEFHALSLSDGTIFSENGQLLFASPQNGTHTITFSDSSALTFALSAPEPIILETWDLTVESWNEGEKVTVTEDRGLGILTKEVYYETKKELLPAGETVLKPWKDIPSIGPAVSGIGYYTAKVTLPSDWLATCRTLLKMDSICGNTAAVHVNGRKTEPVDLNRLTVDITDFLTKGENTILIEVSSTLNNCLLARGYYKKSGLLTLQINDEQAELPEDSAFHIKASVQDYGLTGKVTLIPCKIYPLKNSR